MIWFLIKSDNDPRYKGLPIYWGGLRGWVNHKKAAKTYHTAEEAKRDLATLKVRQGNKAPTIIKTEV